MDFGTMLAMVTAVISVIGFIIGYYSVFNKRFDPEETYRLMRAKAKRLGVAVAEPGQTYYSSTWDAVQQGEKAARANVWPEGAPDYTSDLESALRPHLGPAERCPDCDWERIGVLEGSLVQWVLVEPCAGHAVWTVPVGRVQATYGPEGGTAPLQYIPVAPLRRRTVRAYGITSAEAKANAESWIRQMRDYDRMYKEWETRYRMEDHY